MTLVPGEHYPRTYAEFLAWFPNEGACLDYLDWLRWPDGFQCPKCEWDVGWRIAKGTWSCQSCGRETSVTAGTMFHATRTPLTVWFTAVWFVAVAKDGLSAQNLQRLLGLSSYGTTWTMLHRLRHAMAHDGKARLHGTVEVDETFVGGPRPGRRGRGAANKTIVAIAVERRPNGRGSGRCRMEVIESARAEHLRDFIVRNIEPGSTVVTDAHRGYPPALRPDYIHERHNIAGAGVAAHTLLPAVHRVASLVKRWLLSTHQGGVQHRHLPSYLDEFTFRYNRRNSRYRGMVFYRLLEHALADTPITAKSLVKRRQRVPRASIPPGTKRVHPEGIGLVIEPQPWRRAPARDFA